MNWEVMKEATRLWYARAAQFYLFQNLMLYVISCVAAGHPIGIGKYVEFLNHLFLFR